MKRLRQGALPIEAAFIRTDRFVSLAQHQPISECFVLFQQRAKEIPKRFSGQAVQLLLPLRRGQFRFRQMGRRKENRRHMLAVCALFRKRAGAGQSCHGIVCQRNLNPIQPRAFYISSDFLLRAVQIFHCPGTPVIAPARNHLRDKILFPVSDVHRHSTFCKTGCPFFSDSLLAYSFVSISMSRSASQFGQ